MKKRLLALLAAASMVVSMLPMSVSAAETGHGDYEPVYAVSGSKTNIKFVGTGFMNGLSTYEVKYDDTTDAYYADVSSSDSGLPKNQCLEIKPATRLYLDKYKYLKLMFKYGNWETGTTTNWYFHSSKADTAMRTRSRYIEVDGQQVENNLWESHVVALSEFLPFDSFGGATWYMLDRGVIADFWLKYVVFFENQADAEAYDKSINSFTWRGLQGVIDPIAHTITLDATGTTPEFFEGVDPVIVQDPVAQVTKDAEDPLKYNVVDATGKALTYTVNINYGEYKPNILRFDTPILAEAAIPTIKYYNVNSEHNGTASWDATEGALLLTNSIYSNEYKYLFDRAIPNLSEYKYAKLNYKPNYTNGENTFDIKLDVLGGTETALVRDRLNFDMMYYSNDFLVNPKPWLTDVIDISKATKGADGASRLRLSIDSHANSIGAQVHLKYIALFKTYEEAVEYDNGPAFDGIEISASGDSVTASLDYIKDNGNPKLVTAIYDSNDVLVNVAFNAAPDYHPENYWKSGKMPSENSTDAAPDSVIPLRQATLTSSVNVSEYDDGTYTARSFMWHMDTYEPYCVSNDVAFTVSNGAIVQ